MEKEMPTLSLNEAEDIFKQLITRKSLLSTSFVFPVLEREPKVLSMLDKRSAPKLYPKQRQT